MELLGVKLDDEVLFYVEVDLLALGQLNDLAGEVCAVKVKPLGSGTGSKGLNNSLDLVVGTALLGNSNNVFITKLEAFALCSVNNTLADDFCKVVTFTDNRAADTS